MTQWEMSDGEMERAFRLARDPVMMVEILAELNDVGVQVMKRKLKSLGCALPGAAKGGTRRAWTREEDEQLAQMMDAGYSPAAVALRMEGRSAKGVYNRWKRLQQVYMRERRAYDDLAAAGQLERSAG